MADWDITTAGATLEFDATFGRMFTKPLAIDTNHFLEVWQGNGSDGFAAILAVNTSTWAVTTASDPLEFDTQSCTDPSSVLIDANHALIFWGDSAADGRCQVITVNTTTWAVTTASDPLEFDTADGTNHCCAKIDDTHFIDFWKGNLNDGYAQVFAVNTTTWAVTTAGSVLEYDTANGSLNSCVTVDGNHVINLSVNGSSKTSIDVFEINTTTWAISQANTLEINEATLTINRNVLIIDSTHIADASAPSADNDGFVRIHEINTSTWAVTEKSSLEFDTQDYRSSSIQPLALIDSSHFILAWGGPDSGADTGWDGFAQVFAVNTSTWAVSTAAASFEFDATQGEWPALSNAIAGTGGSKYLAVWCGAADDAFAQVLSVAMPPPTVVLNSPADASSDSDTTPTLNFTGSGTGGGGLLEYVVQVDTVDTFDSQA